MIELKKGTIDFKLTTGLVRIVAGKVDSLGRRYDEVEFYPDNEGPPVLIVPTLLKSVKMIEDMPTPSADEVEGDEEDEG